MRYYAIKLSYGAEYGKGSIEKKNTEKERATVRGVKPEKTSAAGEGAESEKEYIKKETTRCQRQKIMEVETVYGSFVAGAGLALCAGLYVYYCYRTLPDFPRRCMSNGRPG